MLDKGNLYLLVKTARDMGASDIHLTVGLPVVFRIHGKLTKFNKEFSPENIQYIILSMLNDHQRKMLENGEDLDFAIESPDKSRARVNVFRSKGCLSAVLRLLNTTAPVLRDINMPAVISNIIREPRGLILVTGPTGSGKSTTLAAMINEINISRPEHILTIEDPIEYVYTPIQATIRQREVGTDVKDFATALKSALREDPDIILVGEMRDYETIGLALTAAETGHLVMGTLHTTSAPQTIDRIIDACPAESQDQVRTMLAGTLKAVITQTLVPRLDGKGRIAATEILIGTDAINNLIRTNKTHQIITSMQSGKAQGMHTLNANLAELVKAKLVTKEDAWAKCTDREEFKKFLSNASI